MSKKQFYKKLRQALTNLGLWLLLVSAYAFGMVYTLVH